MSTWVLENVRFTLYNGERKERVIVQQESDGLTVTSNPRDDAPEPAKEPAPKQRATAGPKAGAARTAKPEARKDPPRKAATPAEPVRQPSPSTGTPEKKSTSLEWRPIEDEGYSGYAAKSHDGEIMLLKTKTSLWAMYFYWARGVYTHIRCLGNLKAAKEAGQALHDSGPPKRPSPKVTAEMVEQACPVPEAEPAPRETRARKPRAERRSEAATPTSTLGPASPPDPPPAPPSTPPPAGTPTELTPELRAEMRSSLKDAIRDAMRQAP